MDSTGDTLGRYGKNIDSTANILNNYVGVLRGFGVSGKQSIEIIKGMTDSISGMSMAQKALLSARTGGPGGIAGALKIEDLIRKGKTDEVLEMVRKDITKQFGKVVTMDQAIADPRLAGQFEKQRMMLQSGAYGKIAQRPEDATRILDAFKQIEMGKAKPTDLAKNIGDKASGADYIDKGQKLGEQTLTPFGLAANQITGAFKSAAIANLNPFQASFTARSGNNEVDTRGDPNAQMKENTRMAATAARDVGAARQQSYIEENANADLYKDNSGKYFKQDTTEMLGFIENNIRNLIKAPLNTLESLANDGSVSGAENQKRMEREIANARREQRPLRPNDVLSGRARPQEEQARQQNQDKPQEVNAKIDVNVTGYCVSCKNEIEGSAISRSINPSVRSR
jgi:hypothetical protein